ncbi:MAG: ATP-binding cassette domain-containing protein [Dermatophilaceae bacterium]
MAGSAAGGSAGGIPELDLRDLTARWASDPEGPIDLAPTTLRIAPGEHVVITGANGVGKSTLLAVIARALDPVAGRYAVGGADVRDLPLAQARSLLAIVDDEPHVFASTVRENLRLASPGATESGPDSDDGELLAALGRAGLATWFAGLPDGLDTMLGTGWRGLSGGERARLALARAHVSGRPIVLLDEPVAHLDHATAVAVLRDVHAGFAGRTVVMVSHRPDGVEEFDRVIELGETASEPLPLAAESHGIRNNRRGEHRDA